MNYRPLQHNDRAIWTHSATKLGLRPILHGTVRIEINPNLTCRAFYVKNMFFSPQRVFLSGLFLFPKFCRNLKTHQRALYDDPAPVGGSAQPKPSIRSPDQAMVIGGSKGGGACPPPQRPDKKMKKLPNLQHFALSEKNFPRGHAPKPP